jgi:hypothetical protein
MLTIKSGLSVIIACAVLTTANAFIFAESGLQYEGGLNVIIGKSGIFVNSVSFLVAWYAFILGKRTGPHEIVGAIILLSYIHYILISNIFYVFICCQ